jgi:hypothetical protein
MQSTATTFGDLTSSRLATQELLSCGNCNSLLEVPAGLSIESSSCPVCRHMLRVRTHACTPNAQIQSTDQHSASNPAVVHPVADARPIPQPPPFVYRSQPDATAPSFWDKEPVPIPIVFLTGGLAILILGLTIAIVAVLAYRSTSVPANVLPNESTELIDAIKRDVDRIQADVDSSRDQLRNQKRLNDDLEQERTQLLLELSKLEEATLL